MRSMAIISVSTTGGGGGGVGFTILVIIFTQVQVTLLLGDLTSALASTDADRVFYESQLNSFKVIV